MKTRWTPLWLGWNEKGGAGRRFRLSGGPGDGGSGELWVGLRPLSSEIGRLG